MKDTIIATLAARVEALEAENAALKADTPLSRLSAMMQAAATLPVPSRLNSTTPYFMPFIALIKAEIASTSPNISALNRRIWSARSTPPRYSDSFAQEQALRIFINKVKKNPSAF